MEALDLSKNQASSQLGTSTVESETLLERIVVDETVAAEVRVTV